MKLKFASLLLIIFVTGCSSLQPSTPFGQFLFGHEADAPIAGDLSKLTYPGEAELGDDLDIIVVPDGFDVSLANREPQSFNAIQLWLNRQYVGLLPKVAIGTDGNTFRLKDFINEHGEAYPVGGIINPDKTFPIVLAELFDPAEGKRHRLLVRKVKRVVK